ncbi:hypothetical protein [Streptomyces sp. NPDC048442]|uniref:hypothetical protein n=1 Tax=Streptomyces sp. NPDC048442 TaxID=3154823 RepID=UPI0034469BE7
MNTETSTFLNLLVVAFVFFLLALPSLIGHLHDRRIDRQLARAERGLPVREVAKDAAPVRAGRAPRGAVKGVGTLRVQ